MESIRVEAGEILPTRHGLRDMGTPRILGEAPHRTAPPEVMSAKTPPSLARLRLDYLESNYLVCHPHLPWKDGQVKEPIAALLPTMAICPIYRPHLPSPLAIRKISPMSRCLPNLDRRTNAKLVRTTPSFTRHTTRISTPQHRMTPRTRIIGFRVIQEDCPKLPPHPARQCWLLILRTSHQHLPFIRPLLRLLTSNLPLPPLPPLCRRMHLPTRRFRQR